MKDFVTILFVFLFCIPASAQENNEEQRHSAHTDSLWSDHALANSQVACPLPGPWYYMDATGRSNVVNSGNSVLAIESVYVFDDGEAEQLGDAALFIKVDYYLNGGLQSSRNLRLFGRRCTGEVEQYWGEKCEWQDCEGVRYRGFGLLEWGTEFPPNESALLVIQIREADDVGADDIIFEEQVAVGTLLSGNTVAIHDRVGTGEAEIHLKNIQSLAYEPQTILMASSHT